MKIEADRRLLRIHLGESDRAEGLPLYEWIVQRARARGLAGATVLRGIEGFGAASRIHRASILRLSEDLPIVVEIVDAREAIEAFLPELEPHLGGCLVTLEKVEVVIYRAARGGDEAGG
jgi:PII-like signaling protein